MRSPDLVVMGGDSCSRGHQFESQHRVLEGYIYTFIWPKVELMLEKTDNI